MRYNVQNPETKKWRCFSTIPDGWITNWMTERRYQKWRQKQYGELAGELRKSNQMTLEEAEGIIHRREEFERELRSRHERRMRGDSNE